MHGLPFWLPESVTVIFGRASTPASACLPYPVLLPHAPHRPRPMPGQPAC